jgi:hypothetical protein
VNVEQCCNEALKTAFIKHAYFYVFLVQLLFAAKRNCNFDCISSTLAFAVQRYFDVMINDIFFSACYF